MFLKVNSIDSLLSFSFMIGAGLDLAVGAGLDLAVCFVVACGSGLLDELVSDLGVDSLVVASRI